ncbi:fumarylacetoacetate hydrolase family protein [alpha proteobacterium U9-1i]|nr:fumarylacetoacetate hydrolase family protein [alpha proteobacterium U9-1i]
MQGFDRLWRITPICAPHPDVLKALPMNTVIDPPAVPTVAVVGDDARFPVRRIFCVGRNYADHVKEMGNDPKSEPPIFFTKPGDAVAPDGALIPYPQNTSNLHHEIELVLALGKGGKDIAEADAMACVWGYGVGVDLTRRDRQAEAKSAGAPWDVAKAFDNSAPIGPLTPASRVPQLSNARIWLAVNGVVKQEGTLDQMIWSVPEIVASLSRSFELRPGDLIFTGTPAGVGKIEAGDVITGGIDGLAPLKFTIKPG